jgi:hypothetical protein
LGARGGMADTPDLGIKKRQFLSVSNRSTKHNSGLVFIDQNSHLTRSGWNFIPKAKV